MLYENIHYLTHLGFGRNLGPVPESAGREQRSRRKLDAFYAAYLERLFERAQVLGDHDLWVAEHYDYDPIPDFERGVFDRLKSVLGERFLMDGDFADQLESGRVQVNPERTHVFRYGELWNACVWNNALDSDEESFRETVDLDLTDFETRWYDDRTRYPLRDRPKPPSKEEYLLEGAKGLVTDVRSRRKLLNDKIEVVLNGEVFSADRIKAQLR